MKTPGRLFIVATPIGHLDDLSVRARDVLRRVDKIAAEDTRITRRLLQHYQIATPLFSLHAHNEHQRTGYVLDLLQSGCDIALVSDAGTPLISDPGYPIVAAARTHDIRVETIPGACAAIAAISIAGIPCSRFSFEGFLPHKSQARVTHLRTLLSDERTLIFYAAPHRIQDDLVDMIEVFGQDRAGVLARELTKQFETVLTGSLGSLLDQLQSDPNQLRGEMVLIVQGCQAKDDTDADTDALVHLLTVLLAECPVKQAVKIACELTQHKRNTIYAMALEMKKKSEK